MDHGSSVYTYNIGHAAPAYAVSDFESEWGTHIYPTPLLLKGRSRSGGVCRWVGEERLGRERGDPSDFSVVDLNFEVTPLVVLTEN